MNKVLNLIDTLSTTHSLSLDEYETIINGFCDEARLFAQEKAVVLRKKYYSNTIFLRGLIEIGNVCHNNCYYCGIRHDNTDCQRYVLTDDDILQCCKEGYDLGFRTFVMQSGENSGLSTARVCGVIRRIKASYPDCAVTLSLGEYTYEDYKQMKEAGADRYLLRHETADEEHYKKLHPQSMSFLNRFRCLEDLKSLGFQTGCGFMVGSPYQTSRTLAKDLKFIENFAPEMCGIGPFIPHKQTPFRDEKQGDEKLTLYLLSLIRLIKPNVLLPATTALNTINSDGRVHGILAGANVIMPNLSPYSARKKYMLYDKKVYTDDESSQNLRNLKKHMQEIGYKIVMSRGDINECTK